MELEPFNSFLLERLSDLAFLQNTSPKKLDSPCIIWRNFEKLKEVLLYYVKDIQMLSMKWNLDFWNFENWNEVPGKASNSAIFRNWQIK